MIVVEGPDGGGKSTLVQMLVKARGYEIHPRACTSDNGIDRTTLKNWVDQDLATQLRQPEIYDRHPLISEPIYGPIVRGKMAQGFVDVLWLAASTAQLRLQATAIIFCLPPKAVVLDNVRENHDMSTPHQRGVLQHTGAIYEQYAHRAALEMLFTSRTMVWDYTKNDFERVIRNLEDFEEWVS